MQTDNKQKQKDIRPCINTGANQTAILNQQYNKIQKQQTIKQYREDKNTCQQYQQQIIKIGLLSIKRKHLYHILTNKTIQQILIKLLARKIIPFKKLLSQYFKQQKIQTSQISEGNQSQQQLFFEIIEIYFILIQYSKAYEVVKIKLKDIKLSKQAITILQEENRTTFKNQFNKQKYSIRSQQKFPYKNIIKTLSYTILTSLRQIIIQEMGLQNVQILTYLNCPALSLLSLKHNNISTLKTLDKTNLKNLKQVIIEKNKSIKKPSFRIKLNTIQKIFYGYTASYFSEDVDSIPYDLNTRLKYQTQYNSGFKSVLDQNRQRVFQNQYEKYIEKKEKKVNNLKMKQINIEQFKSYWMQNGETTNYKQEIEFYSQQ